ncbi:two-component system response regulator NarL [Halomonas sp. WWR20]
MTSDAERLGVLIVDDHPLFRSGVRQLLDMSDELFCLGEADSGAQALAQVEEIAPDLILLDLNMRDMNGISVLKAMRQAGIGVPIVMLTVSDQEEDIIAAIRAGANGYLLKDMAPEKLLEALDRLAQEEMTFDSRLTPLLAGALRRPSAPSGPSAENLTRREREILRLLVKGHSNKLIAHRLEIREGTVKVHVRHLLKKLNMRSRTEAAVWAAQQGIS